MSLMYAIFSASNVCIRLSSLENWTLVRKGVHKCLASLVASDLADARKGSNECYAASDVAGNAGACNFPREPTAEMRLPGPADRKRVRRHGRIGLCGPS